MADWLNANAAAIQALGSVATVLLTAVLAWITWRYVKLTQSLVSVQLGEATARRRELRSQLDLISGFLREFPSPDERRLSSVLGGYFIDLRDLSGSRVRALAAEVSTEAGHQAAALEEHVTWLINLVRDIRSRGPTYDWSGFPKEEYKARVRSALDACERLSTEVESRETQRPDSDGSAVSAVRGR
jgi:hypothetical protein